MSVKIPWFSSHLWHSHEQFSDVVIFILFLNSNQVSQPQIKQTIFLTFSEAIYNQSRNVIPTLTTHPARLGIPSRMSDYFWTIDASHSSLSISSISLTLSWISCCAMRQIFKFKLMSLDVASYFPEAYINSYHCPILVNSFALRCISTIFVITH